MSTSTIMMLIAFLHSYMYTALCSDNYITCIEQEGNVMKHEIQNMKIFLTKAIVIAKLSSARITCGCSGNCIDPGGMTE